MSEMIAEFTPAPPRGGRTPGLIRPAHTSDAGRDLACRLYSAETGVLIANTETGQMPRGDDVANAAFIRLAWNSHDALVEALAEDLRLLVRAHQLLDVVLGPASDLIVKLTARIEATRALLALTKDGAS